MNVYRVAIIVGQLGRIWTLSHFRRKVYSSMAAIGYFAIMMEVYGKSQQEQVFKMGDGEVKITPRKTNGYKFKKRPF